MLLTEEEGAGKCGTDVLGTCTSLSPIYVSGSHELCVLELFKGDKNGIKKNCQVEILANMVLPKAVNIADGIWAVAIQCEIALSRVCEGKPTQTIRILPPLTMVELSLGCLAFRASMSLPPYYQYTKV